MLKLSNPVGKGGGGCIIINILEIHACMCLLVILKVIPYMGTGVNWVNH